MCIKPVLAHAHVVVPIWQYSYRTADSQRQIQVIDLATEFYLSIPMLNIGKYLLQW